MRIVRLQVANFGCLHERVIEFGTGITVLVGENESGKSTVLHCLAQVLMGKPSQRSLFPDFTPWHGGEFAASLDFIDGEVSYRLTRRFAESGSRAQVLYQLGNDGSEHLLTREAGEIRNRISSLLGVADDKIFYRVFCLTQADITPLDNYAGLREFVERSVSGGEVAVTAAVQRLDQRLASLRRGIGQPALVQNWGPLKRSETQRRDWEIRLQEAHRQQQRLIAVRERVEMVAQRIVTSRERIDEIRTLLEQDRTRRDVDVRLREVRQSWATQETQRDRVAQLKATRDRLAAVSATRSALFDNPTALRARLAALPRPGMRRVAGWVLVAIAVVLGTYCAITHLHMAWGFGLALVLLLGGVSMLVDAYRCARLRDAVLCECGAREPDEVLLLLEADAQRRREFEAVSLALNTMAVEESCDEQRRASALEIVLLEERVAQFSGEPLSMEEAHRLQLEIQRLQESLPALESEERSLLRELAVLESTEQELIDLEDGVAYWRQEERRARAEEEAMEVAKTMLLQAGERAHNTLVHPLAERIEPIFDTMSGGRYPSACVSGDARSLDIYPLDQAQTPIPPEQLSKGTYDQFVLAVRLALGQVIAGEKRRPIFLLDDPLLHFDGSRRRQALTALQTLAAQAQILLVTHDTTVLQELSEVSIIRFAVE